MDILAIPISFCGGAFGAAIGALGAFVMTGLIGIVVVNLTG